MSHALQVYLDETEFKTLQSFAKSRKWTLSQAVRVALRAMTRSQTEEDPLLAGSGMIENLPYDMSQRFGEYLNLTYVAEPQAPYGATPSKRRRTKKPVRR